MKHYKYRVSSIEYRELSIDNTIIYVPIRHSTTVENPLQIDLFMQNKPNLQDVQTNVSIFSQIAYENKSNWTFGENKPNQSQFLEEMFVNFYDAGYYERKAKFTVRQGWPNSQILEFTTASHCGA